MRSLVRLGPPSDGSSMTWPPFACIFCPVHPATTPLPTQTFLATLFVLLVSLSSVSREVACATRSGQLRSVSAGRRLVPSSLVTRALQQARHCHVVADVTSDRRRHLDGSLVLAWATSSVSLCSDQPGGCCVARAGRGLALVARRLLSRASARSAVSYPAALQSCRQDQRSYLLSDRELTFLSSFLC